MARNIRQGSHNHFPSGSLYHWDGNYMDNQKQDLEKVLAPERNAGTIQVEKLNGDILRVTMTDQTAFDFDSAKIKPTFNSTMDKVANVVNRYGKTYLTV